MTTKQLEEFHNEFGSTVYPNYYYANKFKADEQLTMPIKIKDKYYYIVVTREDLNYMLCRFHAEKVLMKEYNELDY